MKSNTTQHTSSRHSNACAIALALLAASHVARADGGNVTGLSVTPNSAFANDSVTVKVDVTGGNYGVNCIMRWDAFNAANVSVKGAKHKMQAASNGISYTFSLALATPGDYTVQARSGPADSQTVSCGGDVKASLTIKDKSVLNSRPDIKMSPGFGTRPAGDQVVQLPGAVLQVTSLSSMKQVANTSHSGETWIEVQGTGHCNYTIESAGVPAQNFASSAAKPFPMKVKIAGAPLGFHNWQAKGTGNCNGTANAGFSVE